MKTQVHSLDIDHLIDRARSLWREARGRVNKGGVELYAKTAFRLRASRGSTKQPVAADSMLEEGLAVRTLDADRAGFAASSGISIDSLRWALGASERSGVRAPAAAPEFQASREQERRDLDPDVQLPSLDELALNVVHRSSLEWVELGITVEVLVGVGGWVAVRRRNRAWACAAGGDIRLAAQRGIGGWQDLLIEQEANHPNSNDSPEFIFPSTPAGVLVSALADYFHGPEPAEWVGAGPGWDVEDRPTHPNGLVGGTFDDVGFPTAPRILARGGIWVGSIQGPGTFRRSSFREPPTEMASNLVVASSENSLASGNTVVRCNILKLSAHTWALELDLVGSGRRWMRTTPQALLSACYGRIGDSQLAPTGPIVPAMRFSGLGSL